MSNTYVVVGADGSEASTWAIDWAAHEAVMRGLPLKIVHAVVWSMVDAPMEMAAMGMLSEDLRSSGEAIVAQARERATVAAPEAAIETDMPIVGSPAQALLDAAETAEVLVVGNRGHGGFTGLLAGSTAVQVAAHAPCPVVVVRPDVPREDPTAPILVGVDGSPEAALGLRFALAEAQLRKAPVRAVYALPLNSGDDPDVHLTHAQAILDGSLADAADLPGSLQVRSEIIRKEPADALIDASRSASMVVVGGRGRGGFRGLLFGSVSHALIHHAECPVVISRGAEEQDERTPQESAG